MREKRKKKVILSMQEDKNLPKTAGAYSKHKGVAYC